MTGRGYVGRSMSVNARECYKQDIKPLSAWRKTDFVDAVENELGARIKSMKGSYKNYLIFDSWHHTSKFYQVTDFYRIDLDKVQNAISQGTILCYSKEEQAEKDRQAVKRIQAQKTKQAAERKQEQERETRLIEEVEGAEREIRQTKKGKDIVTVLVTEGQPGLFKALQEGSYLPVKALTQRLSDRLGLLPVEIRLKDTK